MQKKLFSDFEPSTKEEWLAKVEQDLKGKSIKSLDWQIMPGWKVAPFAHSEDLDVLPPPILGKRTSNEWEIGETIIVNNVQKANQQALHALQNGVNALNFKLPNLPSKEALEQLLQGIQHEWISTHFEIPTSLHKTRQLIEDFTEILVEKKQNAANVKGSIKNDFLNTTELIYFKEIELLLSFGLQALPHFSLIQLDSAASQHRSNNPVKEIALLLSKTNTYLRQFTQNYVDSFQFSIAVDKSYFVNIAKIRAFKLLWNQVQEAYEIETLSSIEATLTNNTLVEDQYENMISAGTQAMSAIVAGVDRLYLPPANQLEQPEGNGFTKRIARNVQHLLQLESYLDHVVDPAAGSYYIEQLTDKLAEKAWTQFQQFEKLGGYQVQKEKL